MLHAPVGAGNSDSQLDGLSADGASRPGCGPGSVPAMQPGNGWPNVNARGMRGVVLMEMVLNPKASERVDWCRAAMNPMFSSNLRQNRTEIARKAVATRLVEQHRAEALRELKSRNPAVG